MSPHQIESAALEGAAIHEPQRAEDRMTSPYLDYVRSTREIIEELITAREIDLAKAAVAAQRRRVERDLTFLRDELARIDAREVEQAASHKGSRVAPK